MLRAGLKCADRNCNMLEWRCPCVGTFSAIASERQRSDRPNTRGSEHFSPPLQLQDESTISCEVSDSSYTSLSLLFYCNELTHSRWLVDLTLLSWLLSFDRCQSQAISESAVLVHPSPRPFPDRAGAFYYLYLETVCQLQKRVLTGGI